VGCLRAHADDPTGLFDQVGDVGSVDESEPRVRASLVGEEVQEVPLRHERDIAAARAQPTEVGEGDRSALHVDCDPAQLGVGEPKELVEPPEFRHHLEGRGVHRVATEVPQEVGVLLEDHDIHALPGQQDSQHHPGRSTAEPWSSPPLSRPPPDSM
jgi:hypothetical protein